MQGNLASGLSPRLPAMDPYRRKVRYWDVDANAHVFNTRYLVYVDDALTDLLDELGLGHGSEVWDGYLMVLAHTEIDYRTEAVIGETLATTVGVERIGTSSITFGFRIVEEGSGRIVAAGKEVYVTVADGDRRPIRVPDQVRSRLG